jgi:hypothetical protein
VGGLRGAAIWGGPPPLPPFCTVVSCRYALEVASTGRQARILRGRPCDAVPGHCAAVAGYLCRTALVLIRGNGIIE